MVVMLRKALHSISYKKFPLCCLQNSSDVVSASSSCTSPLNVIDGMFPWLGAFTVQILFKAPQHLRYLKDPGHLYWWLCLPVYLLSPFPRHQHVQDSKSIGF